MKNKEKKEWQYQISSELTGRFTHLNRAVLVGEKEKNLELSEVMFTNSGPLFVPLKKVFGDTEVSVTSSEGLNLSSSQDPNKLKSRLDCTSGTIVHINISPSSGVSTALDDRWVKFETSERTVTLNITVYAVSFEFQGYG